MVVREAGRPDRSSRTAPGRVDEDQAERPEDDVVRR